MKRYYLPIFVAVGIAIAIIVTWPILFQRTAPFLQTNATVTLIQIEKHRHVLTLYAGKDVVRIYDISLGRGGLKPKQYEGDKRTPEGEYVIDFRKERSGYHRALHISYPNPADVKNAASIGKNAGGDIMIHGIRNGMGWIGPFHRFYDWTAGCVAVTDDEIEEIWQLVKDGTPIVIKP